MSTEQKQKVQVTISGIKADLENGLDRAGIKAKYSLSHNDMKALFQNPKLKNLKPRKAFVPSFELIDDEPEATEAIAPVKAKSKAAIKSDAPAIATAPVAATPAPTAPAATQAVAPAPEAATPETTEANVVEEPVLEKKGLW